MAGLEKPPLQTGAGVTARGETGNWISGRYIEKPSKENKREFLKKQKDAQEIKYDWIASVYNHHKINPINLKENCRERERGQ